jgi:hypothetical protein
MKSILRKFGSKYFWKIIYLFNVLYYELFIDKSKDILVVLTPGKVGSSSVYQSLKNEFPQSYVFHIHFLTEKNISEGILTHKKSDRKSIPYHFITSNIINSFFINTLNRIKFIILFREPIERYISDVYQNSDRLVNKLDINNNAQIISYIKLNLLSMQHMNYLEKWVEVELNENLGYDFFKKSELANKGYYIDKSEKYDFLFMKMERLSLDFNKASKEFFGKEITLERANRSNDKIYYSLYQEAKTSILLSPQIMSKMKFYNISSKIYPIK